MPINTVHKAMISLELDEFFSDMPSTPQDLANLVSNLLASIQNNERNNFTKLAKLFRGNQGIFMG